ncbi:nucleolin 2-like [Eutrema salsugineum]|uniref:nucleolin 2-like n=1 Tax=Eutrema salsugineum TaxID=72664 RepID=UPI000CED0BC7|nr:nucleolin 2-like [Eutrema salsugineum]
MDKVGMDLKKCSASTDVEHAKGNKKRKKSTEHSRKGKEVPASKKMATHDVNIDRQASTIEDVLDEIKRLKDSIKEMTETIKNLPEKLLTKADVPEKLLTKADVPEKLLTNADVPETLLPKPDLPEKETSKGKVNPSRYRGTIFVNGFDPYLPRDDIKSALVKHFGSCGDITCVFVPRGSGYAYIDLENNVDKALELNGSSLGGYTLEVKDAPRKLKDNCSPKCGYCSRERSMRLAGKCLQPFTVKFQKDPAGT